MRRRNRSHDFTTSEQFMVIGLVALWFTAMTILSFLAYETTTRVL
jgi:hypothetical protein